MTKFFPYDDKPASVLLNGVLSNRGVLRSSLEFSFHPDLLPDYSESRQSWLQSSQMNDIPNVSSNIRTETSEISLEGMTVTYEAATHLQTLYYVCNGSQAGVGMPDEVTGYVANNTGPWHFDGGLELELKGSGAIKIDVEGNRTETNTFTGEEEIPQSVQASVRQLKFKQKIPAPKYTLDGSYPRYFISEISVNNISIMEGFERQLVPNHSYQSGWVGVKADTTLTFVILEAGVTGPGGIFYKPERNPNTKVGDCIAGLYTNTDTQRISTSVSQHVHVYPYSDYTIPSTRKDILAVCEDWCLYTYTESDKIYLFNIVNQRLKVFDRPGENNRFSAAIEYVAETNDPGFLLTSFSSTGPGGISNVYYVNPFIGVRNVAQRSGDSFTAIYADKDLIYVGASDQGTPLSNISFFRLSFQRQSFEDVVSFNVSGTNTRWNPTNFIGIKGHLCCFISALPVSGNATIQSLLYDFYEDELNTAGSFGLVILNSSFPCQGSAVHTQHGVLYTTNSSASSYVYRVGSDNASGEIFFNVVSTGSSYNYLTKVFGTPFFRSPFYGVRAGSLQLANHDVQFGNLCAFIELNKPPPNPFIEYQSVGIGNNVAIAYLDRPGWRYTFSLPASSSIASYGVVGYVTKSDKYYAVVLVRGVAPDSQRFPILIYMGVGGDDGTSRVNQVHYGVYTLTGKTIATYFSTAYVYWNNLENLPYIPSEIEADYQRRKSLSWLNTSNHSLTYTDLDYPMAVGVSLNCNLTTWCFSPTISGSAVSLTNDLEVDTLSLTGIRSGAGLDPDSWLLGGMPALEDLFNNQFVNASRSIVLRRGWSFSAPGSAS